MATKIETEALAVKLFYSVLPDHAGGWGNVVPTIQKGFIAEARYVLRNYTPKYPAKKRQIVKARWFRWPVWDSYSKHRIYRVDHRGDYNRVVCCKSRFARSSSQYTPEEYLKRGYLEITEAQAKRFLRGGK